MQLCVLFVNKLSILIYARFEHDLVSDQPENVSFINIEENLSL